MSFVYDISELNELPQFVYDVKILYQLKGYKIRSFQDMCHAFLSPSETESYHRTCQKIKAHLCSYQECGINVNNYTLNEIVPNILVDKAKEQKQALVDRLFNRFAHEEIISFYDTFFNKLQCIHSIQKNMHLKFNFVGTKTGRLSFKNNTFNPYVLPKEERTCIRARDGYNIVQFDIKSSQPRIAIFSTCDDSFRTKFSNIDDIYSAFPGDRSKNKVSFLKWMYSSNYIADTQFGNIAKPIKVLRKTIYDNSRTGKIYNRFGRPLFFSDEPDNIVFQNFVASTEADALYEILLNVQQKLKGKQSRILFPFYDAIVCEIKTDEHQLVNELKNTIESNYLDHVFYCKFPVEIKSGQNFGELQ